MARETVQIEVVKCDGCGRDIDPKGDVNFGCCNPPDPTWLTSNMVKHNGLTLVCYAIKEENDTETTTDCCEHCMRELVRKVKDMV